VPFRTKPMPNAQTVPTTLPQPSASSSSTKPRVALLTSQLATNVMEFQAVWSQWGFRPDLVVIERRVIPPLWVRVRARMSDGRMAQMPNLSAQTSTPRPIENNGHVATATSVLDFCRRAGIAAIEVDSINSDEAIRVLREHKIDLYVYAGAGILKKNLIDSAPLGVLNAHMGLLPAYRGMNVAEWAAWNRDSVGCAVHLIDAGIDTGDILITREVDASRACNIGELRHLVDESQIALLGEVLQYVLKTGELPPRRSQTSAEGLQYFTMHPVLVDILNRRLGGK